MSEAMRRLPNLLIASLGLRKAFSFLKLNAFLKDYYRSSTRERFSEPLALLHEIGTG